MFQINAPSTTSTLNSLHCKVSFNLEAAQKELNSTKPKISKCNAQKIELEEVKLWWHFARPKVVGSWSHATALIMIKGTPLLELSQDEVKMYQLKLKRILTAVHKLGVLHTDLRPTNMLVVRDIEEAYIIDYDLSSVMNESKQCAVDLKAIKGARHKLMLDAVCQDEELKLWSAADDHLMLVATFNKLDTASVGHSMRSLFP